MNFLLRPSQHVLIERLRSLLGPSWYRNVFIMALIALTPVGLQLMTGKISLNHSEIAVEWMKLCANAFFVYIAVGILSQRHDIETTVLKRFQVIDQRFMEPLKQCEKLLRGYRTHRAGQHGTLQANSDIDDLIDRAFDYWTMFANGFSVVCDPGYRDSVFFSQELCVSAGVLTKKINLQFSELKGLKKETKVSTADEILYDLSKLRIAIKKARSRARSHM